MKLITTILRTLVLLIGLNLLVACGGDGMGGTGIEPGSPSNPSLDGGETNNPPALSTISRVAIPFREHGYSNFETLIFNAQEEFDDFVSDVNDQTAWNDKATFLQQIQSVAVDFSKENLLLYRITESSGSITLTPKPPALINDKTTVVIDRQVPEVGTADVAYYALAYKVDKSITEVVFDNGSTLAPVDLTDTPIITTQGKLVLTNSSALLDYFREAVGNTGSPTNQEDSFSAAPVFSGGAESSADISSTNIQELGVDEADLIKTDGRYIYSVKKPVSNFINTPDIAFSEPNSAQSIAPIPPQISSDSIRIMDTQSTTGLSEVKKLSNSENPWSIAGLYLHNDKNNLIALSSEKQNYYTHWIDSFYFINQQTDVLFIDVSNPSESSVKNKLTFDGQLIDSRRNGDFLYMALRHYPNYQFSNDQELSNTTTADFLPKYTLNDTSSKLINPQENCYVEAGQRGSADVITLVAVDLNSTEPNVNSMCFVGATETIYASQNALYLATARWGYEYTDGISQSSNTLITDIHKFSYDGLNLDYRGSGEVEGHLGYRQTSKAFRFSEQGDLLRVVSVAEDQWNFLPIINDDNSTTPNTSNEPKSPVSLSILKEDPASRSLVLVSKLPNANRPDPIGLPGEQLYASRFIGDRAYIITFRVTDPLYALDLSDPADPKIAGELKIDGYSEYLHPISENLLLGVGKDATPSAGEFGGDGRGAWYQGVKLSLIDVTDPSNPREATKVILGKRGTESTALYTHHALTSLKVDDKYRVAIPVRLHSGLPQNSSIPPSVSTHYDYTHTGLYRFDIDINNQTFGEVSPLVVSTSSDQINRDIFNDRSVIINDDVFYLQNGDFWMQDWQGNNPVIGPE